MGRWLGFRPLLPNNMKENVWLKSSWPMFLHVLVPNQLDSATRTWGHECSFWWKVLRVTPEEGEINKVLVQTQCVKKRQTEEVPTPRTSRGLHFRSKTLPLFYWDWTHGRTSSNYRIQRRERKQWSPWEAVVNGWKELDSDDSQSAGGATDKGEDGSGLLPFQSHEAGSP